MAKIVAIHQPNFFPWLGYFDKIAGSDVFVFLDDAQFPKTGGVWSNRVKLLVAGEARWVTAAIDRSYAGTRQIREMHFLSADPWRLKILKTVESSYKKHPFYLDVMHVIEPLVLDEEKNISAYNINAIKEIVKNLDLNSCKLVSASDYEITTFSNHRLCDLTIAVNGQIYMCGGGADGYQDESVFATRGLQLKFQDFDHPKYSQYRQTEFVPGLSIIDALMNLGWSHVGALLRGKNDR